VEMSEQIPSHTVFMFRASAISIASWTSLG
jgi:hypothetical protein